jgi:hypothetical protein
MKTNTSHPNSVDSRLFIFVPFRIMIKNLVVVIGMAMGTAPRANPYYILADAMREKTVLGYSAVVNFCHENSMDVACRMNIVHFISRTQGYITQLHEEVAYRRRLMLKTRSSLFKHGGVIRGIIEEIIAGRPLVPHDFAKDVAICVTNWMNFDEAVCLDDPYGACDSLIRICGPLKLEPGWDKRNDLVPVATVHAALEPMIDLLGSDWKMRPLRADTRLIDAIAALNLNLTVAYDFLATLSA